MHYVMRKCLQIDCSNIYRCFTLHTFYLVFAPAASVSIFNFETDQREAPTTSAIWRWCVRAAPSPCLRETWTNSSSLIGARDTASRKQSSNITFRAKSWGLLCVGVCILTLCRRSARRLIVFPPNLYF